MLPRPFQKIAVVGGGAWGTALAITASAAKRETSLWIREPSVAEAVARTRHSPYLPDYPVPSSVRVSSSLSSTLAGADLVLLVIPSQHLRGVAEQVESLLPAGVPVVICSKGVERTSGLLMTQVIGEAMPSRPQAVLSGPSFASEVAAGQPTAVTVAVQCGDPHELAEPGNLAARVAITFSTQAFRPYVSDDPVGVEVGGAVKNVIAIACGLAAGRGLGSNPRAALITRGLAEIKRLALAMGGSAETVTGLAGVGDLALTCSDEQSRNFAFGRRLAAGALASQAEDEAAPVVEGAANAASVTELARSLGVEMPICEMVNAIVHNGVPVEDAMQDLLTRPLRAERRSLEFRIRLPHPAAGEPLPEALSA